MASMTMTAASFLTTGSASTIAKPSTSGRRSLVMAKAAARPSEGETKKEGSSNSSGRRDLMFAAAAAVASSLAKAALADEPKRGTKEAKEKYAPVCVTMPTARICRN
ncbi:hypothetical protein C1H46_039750 [Malus baccata]|uniref:Photosystem II 5 kDa protein, chloroplastic n=1 Tax=Malus baccata TaxID=106549 RepID=A0A540KKH3_MALBA|nr:hypothetical protein C1H46_039750 [Malus baccata]